MATVHSFTTGSDVAVTSQHISALRILLAFVHSAKDLGDEHVKAIATQLGAIEAVLLVKEDEDAAKAATEAAEREEYANWLSDEARNSPKY